MERATMKRRCVAWEDVERLDQAKDNLISEHRRVTDDVAATLERLQWLENEADRLVDDVVIARSRAKDAKDAYLTQVFQKNCKRLRKNDPDYTSFEPSPRGPYPRGYGEQLGQALQGNTHASSLELSLNEFVTEDDRNEDLTVLLRHIQTSPAMRIIKLDNSLYERSDEFQKEQVGLFLNAMAENPNIERFDGVCSIPAAPLCLFLSKASNVKYVILHSQVWHEATEEGRNNVAAAFRDAGSIESLSLLYDDMTPLILSKMKDCKSSMLRELKLRDLDMEDVVPDGTAFWSAVGQFLRSTSVLEHLELDSFQLTGETARQVIDALMQFRQVSAKLKLTLDNCNLDQEAIKAFIQFLRKAPAGVETKENVPIHSQAPIVLDMRIQHSSCWSDKSSSLINMMTCTAMKQGVESFLTCKLGSATFSTLHTLTLNPMLVNNFFLRLERSADFVFLHTLNVTDMDETTYQSMADSMPRWMSIRKLSIPGMYGEKNDFAREVFVLNKFRENGSLYSVTIRDTVNLSKTELKRIDAYCQRNRFLDQHWRNDTRRLISSNNTGVPSRESETIADSNRPRLVHVANQVPKARASRLLSYIFKVEGRDDEVDQSESE